MSESSNQLGVAIQNPADKAAEPPARITGVIDGYRYPAQINGWTIKRQGDHLIGDLRVEIRRGATVIAQMAPDSHRPDVTQNDTTPAGFVLNCNGFATPQDFADGSVRFFAVDAQGQSKELHIIDSVLIKVKETLAEAEAKSKAGQPILKSGKDRVSYWLKGEKTQNFGDFLSELFASRLFDDISSDAAAVHLIGSVIDDMFVPPVPPAQEAHSDIIFWGCGLRQPGGLHLDRLGRVKILAVRGPLSAAQLGCDASTPQIDPGLLLPALHTPRPAPMFRGRSVCIPHFHDHRSDQELRNASGCEIVLRPNIGNDLAAIFSFADAVAEAGFVLSAALHGAIAAAAYRRPFAFWNNGNIDLPFEWADFAASVGIQAAFQDSAVDGLLHYNTSIKSAIRIPPLLPLLARAPFPVRPSVLLKVLQLDLASFYDGATLAVLDQGLAADKKFGPASGRLVGAIDQIDHHRISGWAVDMDDAYRPVVLEILDNGELIASISAGNYRRDLAAAKGFGDGNHGFEFRHLQGLSRLSDHRVQVRRKSDQKDLPGSPVFLEAEPALLERADQRLFARMLTRTAAAAMDPDILDQHAAFLLSQAEKLLDKTQNLPRDDRATNRATHLDRRWILALAAHIQNQLSAAPEHARPRALFIDENLPLPDHDAGSNAALGQMGSLLRLGYQVTCAATNISASNSDARRHLVDLGIEILAPPDYETVEDVFLMRGTGFDIVYLHRFRAAAACLAMAREYLPKARLVYSVADLHFLRAERQAALEQNESRMLASATLKQEELAIVRMADAVITHSTHEAQLLNEAVPGTNIHVVPWPIAAVPRQVELSERRGIAFIGGYLHAPNVDAAKWLVDQIMPYVWEHDRSIELFLVGSNMPEALTRMASERVVPLGYVKDLARVYNRVRLTVAPLRFGAGVKGKVLDSLAAGLPCVCTTMAAEGIALPSSLQRYVADSPREIAELICRLHADLEANEQCAQAGLEFCRSEFSASRIDALMKNAVNPG